MKTRKLGKVTSEGWQSCESCKMDTLHTPKLGLVVLKRRLCTRCNSSNYFPTNESIKTK